jgi:hypothetical protein
MSTDAFEKLNKVNDTIPNIINQILYLSTEVSRIVIKKILIGQAKSQMRI